MDIREHDKQCLGLIELLNTAKQICFELKIKNSDNPNWYHFDAAWTSIGKALRELKIVHKTEI